MEDVVPGFSYDSDEEDPFFEYVLACGTKLRYTVARDPGTLFNHFLWNGARLLAQYIESHPETCSGKSVLELGAAAAVPSIISALCGARTVVASDYPDPRIVDVMQLNMKENGKVLSENGSVAPQVCGYLWGTDPWELLERNGGQRYDVLLLADVLWLHRVFVSCHQHEDLLKSVSEVLSDSGTALVAFSHHVPGHRESDLAFFELAKQKYGFVSKLEFAATFPHIFNGSEQDVFLFVLRRDATT